MATSQPAKKPEAAKPVRMVRVRATSIGYDNVKVREAGDEFEMPEGATGSWFEPIPDGE